MVKPTDLVLLAGRVLLGAIFVVHGVPKLVAPGAVPFPTALTVGIGVLEVVAALLLILGVFTRAASIPLVGIILGALALVQLQQSGDLLLGLHPELERDLLVLVGLLTVLAFGPGAYSLSARYPRLEVVPNLDAVGS